MTDDATAKGKIQGGLSGRTWDRTLNPKWKYWARGGLLGGQHNAAGEASRMNESARWQMGGEVFQAKLRACANDERQDRVWCAAETQEQ